MYPKLKGYDLKQLKELIERNGWKNVQLSLDDIRSENDKAAQSKQLDDGYCHCLIVKTEAVLAGSLCSQCFRHYR